MYADLRQSETSLYLPENTRLFKAIPRDLGQLDTIIVGQPRCRTTIAASIRALVAANLAGRSTAARRVLTTPTIGGPA